MSLCSDMLSPWELRQEYDRLTKENDTLRAQNAELALSLDVARGDFHRNAAKLWEPLLKAKEDEIERLRARIAQLEVALREFCDRVERGEVKSVTTYAKFKALLEDRT